LRTSISSFMSVIAATADGLAPRTRYDVYHSIASGSSAIDGARSARNRRAAYSPHCSAVGRSHVSCSGLRPIG